VSAPTPRDNPALAGHDAAERLLADSARGGRLPHAWLFVGPAGIGKATLAFRFARWLLAGREKPAEAGLFGAPPPAPGLALSPQERTFRQVAAGGHPDLFVLERTVNPKNGKMRTEIAVEDVRRAIDFMRLTSAEGGRRVLIVDPADDLNPNSANALLKIVEEPPAAGVVLLVNHAPSRIPATIRSRCRVLNLAPLDDAGLLGVLQALGATVPEGEGREALCRLAAGSPGRALALIEAGGVEFYRDLAAILAGLPQLDLAALNKLLDGAIRGKEEGIATLRDATLHWLAERTRALAAAPGARHLDRWAALWENTRHLFERADAATLEAKQALLEIFYDIQAAARPA
jgi:DNA polymerase-3 subunit delta'